MKRWVFMVVAGLFLSGCGQLAKESEFWDHQSMYKDWSHLYFSMGGYKNCDPADASKSKDDGWWGITVPCCADGAVAAPLLQEQTKVQTIAPAKKADQKKAHVKKKKAKSKKKSKSKKKKIKNANP